MECDKRGGTPYNIIQGCASEDPDTVYFTENQCILLSYSIKHNKWEKLPLPPTVDYGLVCAEGELSVVGGRENSTDLITGQIFTLQDGEWSENYVPLETPRSCPAVVSTCYNAHTYIVVAGGEDDDGWTTAVEVLSNKGLYLISNLPKPLAFPAATVTSTMLYVISGDDSNIGFTISLKDLLDDNQEIRSQWTPLPELHISLSFRTPASLCDKFILVGGLIETECSSAIYQLDNNQFVEIGRMNVVTPSPNKMVVAGSVAIVTPSPDVMVVVGSVANGMSSLYPVVLVSAL